ncbi:MAG: porin [Sulfuriflexus sp.]|nr:porin [Sulfuriflexus sp.]
MNKQLLAVAVAAAMFAPAIASASATVYGRVQVEYNVEDDNGTGQDSQQSVDDNAGMSRLGFKFKEKLGGGMTAFGKIEFRIDPADNSASGTNGTATSVVGALGQRDAHVGIKSSWGSLAAGSFHAPYKTAGGVKWDPMVATHLQARRAGGMSGGAGIGGHNGFMRNAIYYTSPNVNGFKVQFAISPDETGGAAAENQNDESDNDYSLAVQYKNGPWHAIFAHNRNNNDGVTRDDESLTKVGLRWKHAAWTLAGQYESISDGDRSSTGGTPGLNNAYRAAANEDSDILWLNAQYKAGNNIFTASYGTTDVDVSGASDYDFDYWMVGVIHKFSKKTRIFGGYTATDGDDDATTGSGRDDRDAWTVGIRQDF